MSLFFFRNYKPNFSLWSISKADRKSWQTTVEYCQINTFTMRTAPILGSVPVVIAKLPEDNKWFSIIGPTVSPPSHLLKNHFFSVALAFGQKGLKPCAGTTGASQHTCRTQAYFRNMFKLLSPKKKEKSPSYMDASIYQHILQQPELQKKRESSNF